MTHAQIDQLRILNARAQRIANDTRTPRWVLWTSLGWRIESAEPKSDDAPVYTFDPQPSQQES